MTLETIPATPDVFSAKRILCIQPHYDNTEIAAAGILRQLQQNGAELFYLAVRRNLLKYICMIQPEFVFTADPRRTYEGHHDHIQTGLATSEAIMFAGLTKITSSDQNQIMDISSTWEAKVVAVCCYEVPSDSQGMDELIMALDMKSQQVGGGESFRHGEPLKVLHTSALHCGF